MIKAFADKHTQRLFATGPSTCVRADLRRRARRKLEYIDLATCVDDLRVPPENRLHMLAGNRRGQYSISINDQRRICFRFFDGDAYDVEIVDYH